MSLMQYTNDLFPKASVFYTPQWEATSWDVDPALGPPVFIQTVINTRAIAASKDEAGLPYSLLIGATSNIVMESLKAIESYSKNGFSYSYRNSYSNSEGSNFTQDDLLWQLTRSPDCNFARVDVPTHNIKFAFSNEVQMNTLTFSSSNPTYDIISTSKASGLTIGSTTSFTSNVAVKGNSITYGSIFGRDFNLWQNKSTASTTSDLNLNKIGYGFRINSNDQLELIKVSTFNDSTQSSKRIAIFGMNDIGRDFNDPASSNYLVFNALNASSPVSTYSNGNLVTAASPLDKVMYVTNGNVGVGTLTPEYGLDVAKTAYFRNDVTFAGALTFNGSIIPSTEGNIVGSSTIPFQTIYAGSGGVNIGIGGSPVVVGNVSGQPVLTVKTTAGAFADIWCSNVSVKNNGSITAPNATITNFGATNIVASNATIHTINVVEQIVTPGADYAEFVAKADPSASYAPGQVLGMNSNGELTDIFADSMHFMIVSSQPSIVGGRLDDSPEFAYSNEKMAFCGRVPVDCVSCSVGDYIVPVADAQGKVSAMPVGANNVSLQQYMSAVGHVVSLSNGVVPIVVVKS